MNKNIIVILLALSLFGLGVSGCGRVAEDKGRVIATIDGEPVHTKDLKRDLALRLKVDPLFRVTPQALYDLLNVMIDRRLLIKEAKKNNLDMTVRFINTIESFWEQTLIRDLMAYKDKELEGAVSVSEDELRDYYNKLSYRMTIKIVKRDKKASLIALLSKDPEEIAWDEEIGPISIEDASSPVIFATFDLDEGQKKVISYQDSHYLIYAKRKEQTQTQPFDGMKQKINTVVKKYKKRTLFNSWLNSLREEADITIDSNSLKEAQYKYSRE